MPAIAIIVKGDKLCVVNTDDTQHDGFEYHVEETVNLNDLVKYISDLDSKIVITPASPADLTIETGTQSLNEKIVKLSEYLYKILESFNISYDEVYSAEEVSQDVL